MESSWPWAIVCCWCYFEMGWKFFFCYSFPFLFNNSIIHSASPRSVARSVVALIRQRLQQVATAFRQSTAPRSPRELPKEREKHGLMGTSIYSYAKGLYVSVVSPPCHISLRPQRMKDFASSRIRVRPTLVGIVIKTRTNNRQQQQHKNSTKKKNLSRLIFLLFIPDITFLLSCLVWRCPNGMMFFNEPVTITSATTLIRCRSAATLHRPKASFN